MMLLSRDKSFKVVTFASSVGTEINKLLLSDEEIASVSESTIVPRDVYRREARIVVASAFLNKKKLWW